MLALTAGYLRWRPRTSNARRMSEKPRDSAKNPTQISRSSARAGNSCWETQKPSRISSTPAIMPSHQVGLISREEMEVTRSRLPRKISSSPKIVASAQNAPYGLANDQQAASYKMRRSLIGNVGRLPRLWPWETLAGSGAGGHECGQDVVRVAVEVLAGSVIPHRGARIGVPGGDLDITQVDSRVEHGRDECVSEHVRVRLGDLDAGGLGES